MQRDAGDASSRECLNDGLVLIETTARKQNAIEGTDADADDYTRVEPMRGGVKNEMLIQRSGGSAS